MFKGIRKRVGKLLRRKRKPVIVIKPGESPWRRDKLVRVTVPNIHRISIGLAALAFLTGACSPSQPQPGVSTSPSTTLAVVTQGTPAAPTTEALQSATEVVSGGVASPGTIIASTPAPAGSETIESTEAISDTETVEGGVMETLDPVLQAVDASVSQLTKSLGVNPADVQILSAEPADWPDACLGLAAPGEVCAQVVTPGYQVTLEVNGKQYEFHTDASGTQVRQK